MKATLACVVLAIVSATLGFALGVTITYHAHHASEKYYLDVIDKYIHLDSASRTVIDNSNLLDTDGSDAMSDYLSARKAVDSIYDGEQPQHYAMRSQRVLYTLSTLIVPYACL